MRSYVEVGFAAHAIRDLSTFAADPQAWFTAQGPQGAETWLLAHAEDGVVWGKLENGKLVLAPGTALHARTLLEARLFGTASEVHIWRTDEGFAGCKVTETTDGSTDAGAFDKWLRLWGTEVEGKVNGFTQLADGQEGLRHTVPIELKNDAFGVAGARYQPTRLKTRHYFTVDKETGVTSIALSRLVCIDAESIDEYRERVKNNE